MFQQKARDLRLTPTNCSPLKTFSLSPLTIDKAPTKQTNTTPTTTNNANNKRSAAIIDKLINSFLDEDLPPSPYPTADYFALNTFRSTSKTLPPTKLCRAIATFLQNSPLIDICIKKIRDWQLQYEFFHRDRKIEFCISFFEDNVTPTKGSCLIEMHRIAGDHEAFQRVADILRQRYELVYAFGFMTETTEEPTKASQTFDFFLDAQAPPSFEPCSALLHTVLKHVESPYADVQIHGWHTLSQITRAKPVAEALLESKVHGRDAFEEIKSRAATSRSSHDQHRLISKTMSNVMKTLNTDQARRSMTVV